MLLVLLGSNETALREHISNEIKAAAERHKVCATYLAAIAYQESVKGSDTLLDAVFAHRQEKQFFLRYILNKPLAGFVYQSKSGVPSNYSERKARAASWGLFQIMGTTAREAGFDKQYIPSLQIPAINIEFGARIFRAKLDKANQDYRGALLYYNGGGDPSYPEKILGHIRTGNYKRVLIES